MNISIFLGWSIELAIEGLKKFSINLDQEPG